MRTPDETAAALEANTSLGDLHLDDLCAAYEAMLSILSAIGPALMIQVRNDNNNLRKLRAAMAATGCTTIRSLLLAEIASGVHSQGAVQTVTEPDQAITRVGGATLADPSGAMALLWLTRSLNFTLQLAEGLLRGAREVGTSEEGAALTGDEHLLVESDGDLAAELLRNQGNITSDAISTAYNNVIRPYHSWLLRKTFDMCASQVPCFSDVVDLLGSGLGDADREVQIMMDMGLFCKEGFPIVQIIERLFEQLMLQDLRKV